DGEFIHAQGAKERIAANPIHDVFFSGDDAGLRTAEQFIATERDYGCACLETRASERFGDAAGGKIHGAAGAEILEHGDASATAKRDEVFERNAFGETSDAEIRGMHAKEKLRAVAECLLVIAQVRAIRGADFMKRGAACGHDVRDAEAVADLDEFAAPDEHFGAPRESVQHEKNGGRVVIHYDRGFGADKFGGEARGVN